MAGQKEEGGSGYLHWQGVIYFANKVRMSTVKHSLCDSAHVEPTKSVAALSYVEKLETRIDGTGFRLGDLPFHVNSRTDWESVRRSAKSGDLDSVPANVYVQNYRGLKQIAVDHIATNPTRKSVKVYWGSTGVGKSRRAWWEAGLAAYPKDPRTKWWCGFRSQEHIVIDEYRGGIDIGHLLRWLDRYPSLLETKGGTVPCSFKKVWITSNLHPNDWYPELDVETKEALLRRLDIEHMTKPWTEPEDLVDVDELINLI